MADPNLDTNEHLRLTKKPFFHLIIPKINDKKSHVIYLYTKSYIILGVHKSFEINGLDLDTFLLRINMNFDTITNKKTP